MAGLAGLPDFQTYTSTATASMFAPFQNGSYSALPQQLAIASDADGNPKFQLELIERFGDFSASGQYAVLDISLAGDFQLDDALAAARSGGTDATVKPITVNSGFARLYPTAGEVSAASDVLAPIQLGWLGSDYARWTTRLSASAGALIKGAITGGSLLLGARVEFDAIGVAPRIPATVEFEPAKLINSLLAGASARQMSTADLLAAFTGSPQNFPVRITGTPSGDFAMGIASRLIAAYATLVPAPGILDSPYVVYKDVAQLPAGTVTWDLNQPALGYRQWVLSLDVLTSLRALVAKNGVGTLVKNVTIPPLDVGFCNIDFSANLPQNRFGVPAIGVNVAVEASPPFRPSSIAQTATFTEPGDSASVQFRLSPSEQLKYTLSGYAVVAAGQMVQEFQMPPQPRTDSWVHLAADDFPVAFAHVTAADRLLALATVEVQLSYTVNGEPQQLRYVLKSDVTGVAMAVPRSATGTSLAVTAVALDGGQSLTLPSMQPGRIDLDVTAFREYGPHTIGILSAIKNDAALFLDFLAEEQTDVSGATPVQLFLSVDQPNATWSYVVTSPFRAGYRYRKSAATGIPAAAWSPILSPFAPLVVNADGTMAAAGGNGSLPSTPRIPSGT